MASGTDQPDEHSFYRELPSGHIEHRAEPIILALALLVIPAIVLEEASASWLRTTATALNVVIWVGFAAELAFVLSVSKHRRRTLRACHVTQSGWHHGSRSLRQIPARGVES